MDDAAQAWTVEPVSSNVHVIRFLPGTISKGWEQKVLLTADRHIDSPDSDHKLQKQHLEQALEWNAPVIDVGDVFDAMQGRNDRRRSASGLKDGLNVDDYFGALIEDAEDKLAPYAHLMAVIGRGNHETAILRHNQLDLTKFLVKGLRQRSGQEWPFAGGYGGYIIFRFQIGNGNKMSAIVLKYYHGKGGSAPVTRGVIHSNRNSVSYPDADIVISGHIHEGWHVPIPRERVTKAGTVRLSAQHHISIPSYKDGWGDGSGGFDVEKLSPKVKGCAWLTFKYREAAHNFMDIDVNIEMVS